MLEKMWRKGNSPAPLVGMSIDTALWRTVHSVVSDSLWPHGLHSPWNSLGQNIGVGICSLLQRIFPTQGSNPGLLHCGQILYHLSHQGSPRILEWVAYPFSSRSSWTRNKVRVSCIARGIFTSWANREAHGRARQNQGHSLVTSACSVVSDSLWPHGL